jgi:hypothetical protein
MTALVNPSSSIADGAFTLTITLPRSSPALTAATLNPEGIALPLGTSVDGALGVEADGALGVVDGLGSAAMLGLGAVAIFGSVELLETLGLAKDGAEIVDTLPRNGIAL